MLAQIQPEESLYSFLARNIFLKLDGSVIHNFERILNFRINSKELKIISAALGWAGCYGFNRLLHEHTSYPCIGLIKHSQDISYSGADYLADWYVLGSDLGAPAYCPVCVVEDIQEIGFSYWRRTFANFNICAKHNLVMHSNCPFCGEAFSTKNHGLDVMWKGCAGRQISQSGSSLSVDISDGRIYKFLNDAFNSDYVICLESALAVMSHKRPIYSGVGNLSGELISQFDVVIKEALHEIRCRRVVNDGAFMYKHSHLVWLYAPLVYERFSDLVEDLQSSGVELRPVKSFWSCYSAGGVHSAKYIQEDYQTGVGVWSCPYPSELEPLSLPHVNERAIKIYQCCNIDVAVGFDPRKRRPVPLYQNRVPVLQNAVR